MSTELKLIGVLCGTLLFNLLGIILCHYYWHWSLPYSMIFSLLLVLGCGLLSGRFITRRMRHGLQALNTGLLNFHDNDFSVSLTLDGKDEWHQLAQLYNKSAAQLRSQRTHIYQRELLLDSVLQNTSTAIVLTDANQRILYANLAARHLLYHGRPLENHTLPELDNDRINNMLTDVRGGLFTLRNNERQEIWHLHVTNMRMNGIHHILYQFKPLTQELTRAEIHTWKKVIRVISHELNNSLAPISSMAHSGQQLLKGDINRDMLERIFVTISERSDHLNTFLQEYADFARLPPPQKTTFSWLALIEPLHTLYPFQIIGEPPPQQGWADPHQLTQVLVNLLKNAQEATPSPTPVTLQIHQTHHRQWLTLRDHGPGMTPEALAQALLPFYSTKPEGTGLGLALCKEIIEGHDGQLTLSNQPDGGLEVRCWLPTEAG